MSRSACGGWGHRAWCAAGLVVLAAGLAGCSRSRAIVIDPLPYAGPEVRFAATEKTHLAIFTVPSGGWSAERDLVRDRFDARQVFVTLRRPAPTQITTQAITEHQVDTDVRLTENVEVFTRVMSGAAEESTAYRLAGSAKKR